MRRLWRPASLSKQKLAKAIARVAPPRVENRARPVPGKVQPQQKLRYRSTPRESRSHQRKPFVSEPTSSPNVDADLRCLVTPTRIGWKRSDSCSQRPVAGELRLRDCKSPWLMKWKNLLSI